MGNAQGKRTADKTVGDGWHTYGDYCVNILAILGQGSFGVVFEGKEKLSGDAIAVKRIEVKGDERRERDAFKEIANLQKLPKHPNLVEYKGYHFISESFWVAMEFCDMGDLSGYYKEHFPIPLAQQIHFMYQISSAIAHLHSRATPIIHRDIKPPNVMLCKNRHGHPIVKLTDFGISKVAPDGMSSAKSLLMTTVGGTPAYMAPEFFIEDAKIQYDKSVDTFAMGILFLTMLQAEKKKPLESPTVGASMGVVPLGMKMNMARMMGKPPIKLVEIKQTDPRCIKQVKQLIPQMCDVDPKKRPSVTRVNDVLKDCFDSVQSNLKPDVLEATLTRTVSSGASRDSQTVPDALAYLLIHDALKELMVDKVEEEEEEERVESIPLMELLGMVSGPSHKKEIEKIKPGNMVVVDANMRRVRELQDGYGGWSSNMENYLGQSGKVQAKLLHMFKVRFADGQTYCFNPAVLSPLDDADKEAAELEHQLEGTDFPSDPSARRFERFTIVEVINDVEILRAFQTEEYGGFTTEMLLVPGIRGIVNRVKRPGKVYVECINGQDWWLNPEVLSVVDTDAFEIEDGDFVVISNNRKRVEEKQKGHGRWIPEMEKALGKTGIVKRVDRDKRVAHVETRGRTWVFNIELLRHVARAEDVFGAILKKRLFSELTKKDD